MALVADDSGSMSGKPAQDVTEGIRTSSPSLQSYGRGEKSYFRLLFVKFGDQPTVVQDFADILTVRPDQLQVAGNSGSTNMDRAGIGRPET